MQCQYLHAMSAGVYIIDGQMLYTGGIPGGIYGAVLAGLYCVFGVFCDFWSVFWGYEFFEVSEDGGWREGRAYVVIDFVLGIICGYILMGYLIWGIYGDMGDGVDVASGLQICLQT